MDIKPIRTEADHKAALKEISALMEHDPELGTAEGDRLDILSTLVEAYENRHFPMDLPDPVEAILFRMEQQGRHAMTGDDSRPRTSRMNWITCTPNDSQGRPNEPRGRHSRLPLSPALSPEGRGEPRHWKG
jgi:HTH-type transcriptional regulator/antitoxin HigA